MNVLPGGVLTALWIVSAVIVIGLEAAIPYRSDELIHAYTAATASPSQARPADRGEHDAEWVRRSLERPLFSPGRRPPHEGSGNESVRTVVLPRLSAIIVSAKSHVTVFEAESPARSYVVAEGSTIYDRMVSIVEASRVQVVTVDGVTSWIKPTVRDATDDDRRQGSDAPQARLLRPPGESSLARILGESR